MINNIEVCPKCRALKHMQPCDRCRGHGYMRYAVMGGIPFAIALRPDKSSSDAEALMGLSLKDKMEA